MQKSWTTLRNSYCVESTGVGVTEGRAKRGWDSGSDFGLGVGNYGMSRPGLTLVFKVDVGFGENTQGQGQSWGLSQPREPNTWAGGPCNVGGIIRC